MPSWLAFQPQRRVEQQALGQEQLGGRDVEVDALASLRPDRAQDVMAVVQLVLHAERDLRQQRVLAVDRITEQPDFRAEHVLAEGEALAEPERPARAPRVEQVPRVGQLDPVVQPHRRAERAERVVADPHHRAARGSTDGVARAVAGDHRPRREAAARRSLQLRDAGRGQQPSAVGRHEVGSIRGRGRPNQGAQRRSSDQPAQSHDHSPPPCNTRHHAQRPVKAGLTTVLDRAGQCVNEAGFMAC